MKPGRFPVIIAAAGKSRRYGRPKLLEKIPGKSISVIERVIRKCIDGGAGPLFIVVGPESDQTYRSIGEQSRRQGADVLHIDPAPAEMRQSIESGMREIERSIVDSGLDVPRYFGFMPADLPGISSEFVRELIAQVEIRTETLVRAHTSEGRGLHPVAIEWAARDVVFRLPAESGLNALWANSGLSRFDFLYEGTMSRYDLDKPQDWQKFPFPRDRSVD